jgi:hypothetical protein
LALLKRRHDHHPQQLWPEPALKVRGIDLADLRLRSCRIQKRCPPPLGRDFARPSTPAASASRFMTVSAMRQRGIIGPRGSVAPVVALNVATRSRVFAAHAHRFACAAASEREKTNLAARGRWAWGGGDRCWAALPGSLGSGIARRWAVIPHTPG